MCVYRLSLPVCLNGRNGIHVGIHGLVKSNCLLRSIRAPTSGGQYHWVSEFAPKSCQKFLSYLTGWVSVMGWQTGITSVGFLAATQIQGLLVLNYPEYELQRWHGTLLLIAVVLFSIFFNTVAAKYLPMVEGLILIVHVFGFFALMIPLWALAPRNDASLVFTEFNNGGEWPTQGISCMVGMLSAVFGLFGADSANHMGKWTLMLQLLTANLYQRRKSRIHRSSFQSL